MLWLSDIEPRSFTSERAMHSHMHQIQQNLSRITEDWEKRVQSMKSLAQIVEGKTHLKYSEAFFSDLQAMKPSICTQMQDRRSKVIGKVCALVIFLCRRLGSMEKFWPFVDSLIPVLLKLTVSEKGVIRHAAQECLCNCISHSGIGDNSIHQLDLHSKDPGNDMRARNMEAVFLVLTDQQYLDLHKHKGTLENLIVSAVRDRSEEVRHLARQSVWAFKSKFPDHDILDKFEDKEKNAILKARSKKLVGNDPRCINPKEDRSALSKLDTNSRVSFIASRDTSLGSPDNRLAAPARRLPLSNENNKENVVAKRYNPDSIASSKQKQHGIFGGVPQRVHTEEANGLTGKSSPAKLIAPTPQKANRGFRGISAKRVPVSQTPMRVPKQIQTTIHKNKPSGTRTAKATTKSPTKRRVGNREPVIDVRKSLEELSLEVSNAQKQPSWHIRLAALTRVLASQMAELPVNDTLIYSLIDLINDPQTKVSWKAIDVTAHLIKENPEACSRLKVEHSKLTLSICKCYCTAGAKGSESVSRIENLVELVAKHFGAELLLKDLLLELNSKSQISMLRSVLMLIKSTIRESSVPNEILPRLVSKLLTIFMQKKYKILHPHISALLKMLPGLSKTVYQVVKESIPPPKREEAKYLLELHCGLHISNVHASSKSPGKNPQLKSIAIERRNVCMLPRETGGNLGNPGLESKIPVLVHPSSKRNAAGPTRKLATSRISRRRPVSDQGYTCYHNASSDTKQRMRTSYPLSVKSLKACNLQDPPEIRKLLKDATFEGNILQSLDEVSSEPLDFKEKVLDLMKALKTDIPVAGVSAEEELRKAFKDTSIEKSMPVLLALIKENQGNIDMLRTLLKIFSMSVSNLPADRITFFLEDIFSVLLASMDSDSALVRMRVSSCFVALHSCIGDAIFDRLQDLSKIQLRLIRIYIRKQSQE